MRPGLQLSTEKISKRSRNGVASHSGVRIMFDTFSVGYDGEDTCFGPAHVAMFASLRHGDVVPSLVLRPDNMFSLSIRRMRDAPRHSPTGASFATGTQ